MKAKQITISNKGNQGPRLSIARRAGNFAEDVKHVKPAPNTPRRLFNRALGTR